MGDGRGRRRLRLIGVVLLALCIGVGFAAGDATAKKKKKKGPSVFSGSVTVNAPVPDQPGSGQPDIVVSSTINIGKKFKGKRIGDVNVTGIKTTGDSSIAAGDLNFSLTAPDGRTVLLDDGSLGGQSIGPLTLDDDTLTSICNSSNRNNCPDPDANLIQPFVGTANLANLGAGGLSPLSMLNGGPMVGTWTFRIWDSAGADTSTFNTWGIQVTARKPVKK